MIYSNGKKMIYKYSHLQLQDRALPRPQSLNQTCVAESRYKYERQTACRRASLGCFPDLLYSVLTTVRVNQQVPLLSDFWFDLISNGNAGSKIRTYSWNVYPLTPQQPSLWLSTHEVAASFYRRKAHAGCPPHAVLLACSGKKFCSLATLGLTLVSNSLLQYYLHQ